jgi:hypothetical protein
MNSFKSKICTLILNNSTGTNLSKARFEVILVGGQIFQKQDFRVIFRWTNLSKARFGAG